MSIAATIATSGLEAGTWEIDPSHSSVEFSVRHMMFSKVKGRFGAFRGTIVVGEDPADSSVEATVEVASIDTGDEQRDAHLRGADFFDVERYPEMTFVSRSVRQDGDRYVVAGDLTLHGVTRPVELNLELNGIGTDPYGRTKAGFSATTELSRKEFGLEWNVALDTGGVLVGDKVQVSLEIQASRQ
ncbi:MAG: YceI family protein [Actinomycetota bacterium]|nr:YceI family protein [Actinomycetota bacterium]